IEPRLRALVAAATHPVGSRCWPRRPGSHLRLVDPMTGASCVARPRESNNKDDIQTQPAGPWPTPWAAVERRAAPRDRVLLPGPLGPLPGPAGLHPQQVAPAVPPGAAPTRPRARRARRPAAARAVGPLGRAGAGWPLAA